MSKTNGIGTHRGVEGDARDLSCSETEGAGSSVMVEEKEVSEEIDDSSDAE